MRRMKDVTESEETKDGKGTAVSFAALVQALERFGDAEKGDDERSSLGRSSVLRRS